MVKKKVAIIDTHTGGVINGDWLVSPLLSCKIRSHSAAPWRMVIPTWKKVPSKAHKWFLKHVARLVGQGCERPWTVEIEPRHLGGDSVMIIHR